MVEKISWQKAVDALAGMGMEISFEPNDVANIVSQYFPDGLPLRKGWRQKMWVGPNGIQFRDYNPMLAAKGVPEAFYVVQNGSHPYGAPQDDEESGNPASGC